MTYKNRNSTKLKTAIAAACLAMSLSACGSFSSVMMSTKSADLDSVSQSTSPYWAQEVESADTDSNDIVYNDSASDTAFGVNPDGTNASNTQTDKPDVTKDTDAETDRKLITTVDLDVQTKNFDALQEGIESAVNSLGGYIQSSNTYNNSYSYYDDEDNSAPSNRSASYTLRIPEDKLDEFLTELRGEANVTRESKSTTDITLDYVDTAAHKRALETEEKSLETMLKKASELDDIVKIQSRLTDVQYQIDSIESQLRTYDNQVDYSTVNLNIDEVAVYQPSSNASIWSRISSGFKESVHSVARGFSDAAVWIIVHIPQILVAAVFLVLGIFVSRKIGKKVKKRREVKEQQKMQQKENTEQKEEKHDEK